MPEPAMVVDAEDRAVAANKPALALLPALRLGEPLVLALRTPDVIDAMRAGLGGRRSGDRAVERAGADRAAVRGLRRAARNRRRRGRRHAADPARSDRPSRRLERMRVDFIANASHELRTPLASMLGFIETLQGSARDDDAGARAVPRHHARAGAAHGAPDRRSAVAVAHRAEAACAPRGGGRSRAKLARHVADTLAPMAREMGVEIKLEADQPVIVTGERDELVRVAENLIENAIKYGARPGQRRRRPRRDRGRAGPRAKACWSCAISAAASRPNICRA